jgi:hypothetical protein
MKKTIQKIKQKFLQGVQGGGFFKKSPPGRRRQVKYLLLAAVIVISIKPFLFTLNFIQASFHLKKNILKAGPYMSNVLTYKPSVYHVFNKYSPAIIENYLVKSAILNKDPKWLQVYSHIIPLEAIQKQYKDNFYLQDLLGNIEHEKEWQHLDEVSFVLLADPRMNQCTITIWNKIGFSFDKKFIRNLVDFLAWKGNRSLVDDWVSK